MKQENKYNVQLAEVFTFKNNSNYTWTEKVTRFTDKSIFVCWENGHELRESWNSFNKKIEKYLVERKFELVRISETKFVRVIIK